MGVAPQNGIAELFFWIIAVGGLAVGAISVLFFIAAALIFG